MKMKFYYQATMLILLLCSCISSRSNPIEVNTSHQIKGIIVNGRYYPEDRGFSVIASVQNSETLIIEREFDYCRSVTFETPMGGTTVRYDIFPMNDVKCYLEIAMDMGNKQSFLQGYFHEIILPSFLAKGHEIKLGNAEIIFREGDPYYFAIFNGKISLNKNLHAKKSSEDHVGMLLTLKDQNLVAITLYKGIQGHNKINDLKSAKDELLPTLLQLSDEFIGKMFLGDEVLSEVD